MSDGSYAEELWADDVKKETESTFSKSRRLFIQSWDRILCMTVKVKVCIVCIL